MKPRYFATPADFRRWLQANHDRARELLVGLHKKDSGKPSMSWPESVDEALCVGWIDGVRRRVDEHSYSIRFSPRRRGSIWSAINIARVEALSAEGRMQRAGLQAFAARTQAKSVIYSYEQAQAELTEPYLGLFKQHPTAWKFFQTQPPGYRHQMSWRILSAKQEATRLRRLEKLIAASAQGLRLL